MLKSVEWPTLGLVVLCYAGFALATTVLVQWSVPAAVVTTALTVTLHASLTHEVVHGHPFRSKTLNMALVFPALSLMVPYGRFRDTHLDHHRDANLTDPYDDPESNYLDPVVWARLPWWVRPVLRFNNTLLGRIVIGPIVGQIAFILGDIRLSRGGDKRVAKAWLWHIPAVLIVVLWIAGFASMTIWAFVLAVYAGNALLRIRTFLEHQAHARASGRTVIVEDRGLFAFLFLNNNLHVVHHKHPRAAWYHLPQLYVENRAHYLTRNGSYVYRSYAEIFRRYFLRAKDPVPHPLWPGADDVERHQANPSHASNPANQPAPALVDVRPTS
jgi:fatty acid desaturase